MINEKSVGQMKLNFCYFPNFFLSFLPLSEDTEERENILSRAVEINTIFSLESNRTPSKGDCFVYLETSY